MTWVSCKVNLHSDNGFLISTRSPQNQREEREEDNETEDKDQEIAPAGKATAASVAAKESLLLDSVEVVAGGSGLAVLVAAGAARARKAGGGGTTGMMAGGSHGAESGWGGVKRVGSLLAVLVGVSRRGLHEVRRTEAGGPPRGGRGQAGGVGVRALAAV